MHALHSLPFDMPIANALEREYRSLPLSARLRANRKLLQREGLLRFTGQAGRRVERVPADVRRLLWVYTWTTVGDSILDLAPRSLIPGGIEVELCIAPALAPLFTHDSRFARVHIDPAACGQGYDFLLLDCLSTASIRLKTRHFAALPFASLRGHLLGECYDRAAFSDRRVRQLFDLPPGEVIAPWLALGEVAPAAEFEARYCIAVVLGARVAAKRYPQWPAVLEHVLAKWPADRPAPCFHLLGHGPAAEADLSSFDAGFVERHARVSIGRGGSLRDAALEIAGCDAFLGVDGGLMHVAAAVGTPGLALFTRSTRPGSCDPGAGCRPCAPMAHWPM